MSNLSAATKLQHLQHKIDRIQVLPHLSETLSKRMLAGGLKERIKPLDGMGRNHGTLYLPL